MSRAFIHMLYHFMQIWLDIVTIGPCRKKRLFGLLCGRNIAKKRDFCSFHAMRYLLAAIIFIGSTSQSLAGFCDDLPEVMRSNDAEFERLLARYKSHIPTGTEACIVGHRELLPLLDKTVTQLYYYKDCNDLAAEKYAGFLKAYKDLLSELRKCK